ncbi:hypothetical protein [Saccharomonospora viridis]|uniref:Uncharacterized protein n=1 Tax=Saccharomonospora viridis TaxID=1852 RepID=A0A837D9B9_9PSEU|nr:hypothetical protein [Saccharomonospora viridis]KHF44022.1 hypothetical protein MINT15_23270 [Saccharomonospora viridis]SFP90429.1 hypothetical protein SAMN02982918_3835 [Saccharomonospora viridis]
MARKWGKRKRSKSPVVVPQALDVEAMFDMPRPMRQARQVRPPASSTPLADQLGEGGPGVTESYVVLPRSLAENMPLPWQQQMASLLAQFHETHGDLSWPTYRVVPSRSERLVDLDEEQLAEVGYFVELDTEGEMVYRDRTGRRVDDPENTVVLVSCLDPIVRRPGGSDDAEAAAESEREQRGQARPGAVPMNIGPQPVWRTTPTRPTAAPPLPPPPTAPSVSRPPGSAEPAGSTQPAVPDTPDTAEGERGWFDEMAEATGETPVTSEPGAGGEQSSDDSVETEFGPTGDEPTEIPYRYRR